MTESAPATSKQEVLFYHLEHQPLERVLPSLVEKTIERGWRAVIQSGNQERLDAIDTALWTFRDDSFLPHGTESSGSPELQPVFLTMKDENPNSAGVRFLIEGADCSNFEGYIRIVYLFDGRDQDAVAQARNDWKFAKDQGCSVTYWQQSQQGGWQKKA
jgi:DNA polymerase III subunit chi